MRYGKVGQGVRLRRVEHRAWLGRRRDRHGCVSSYLDRARILVVDDVEKVA